MSKTKEVREKQGPPRAVHAGGNKELVTTISIVTMNRRDILARTLAALWETCKGEDIEVLVTDNGSTDDTGKLLISLQQSGSLIKAYFPNENLGTACGRNMQIDEWLGHDMVRLDDKCLPLVPGWLKTLKRQAYENHAIVAVPYDPSVQFLWSVAPPVGFVPWNLDQGQGGPVIFIPGEVTTQLGAVDILHPDIKYGWDDVLYIERARLLGWGFGFSLRAPFEFLAQASPESRQKALEYHPLYLERLRQYREAERDLYIAPGENQV